MEWSFPIPRYLDRAVALSHTACFLLSSSSALSSVPALSLFAREKGMSAPEIGIVLGAPLLVAVVVAQTGVATAALNRRRATAIGALILALTPMLFALASDFWQLLSMRVVYGLGLALLPSLLVATAAGAAASWHGNQRLAISALAGWVVGPAISGYLVEQGGAGAAFALASLLALGGLSVALLVPDAGLQWGGDQSAPPGVRGVPAPVALHLAVGAVEAFLPLYILDLGLGPRDAGLLFAVYAGWVMGSSPLVASLATKAPGALSVSGLLLAAAACAGLGLGVRFPLLVLAMAACGLGTMAVAASRRPRTAYDGGQPCRARACNFAPHAAHAAGPIVGGLAMHVLGGTALFLLLGIGVALAAVVSAVLVSGDTLGDPHRAAGAH